MVKKNVEVEENASEQIVKITDWKQVRVKNQETKVVPLEYPDGSIFGAEINSLSKATQNALNDKYDGMKKAKPDKVFDKDLKKWVNAPEGSQQYIEWENYNKAIDNLKAAETIILALVNKPDGDTLEEQVEFLQGTLKSGQFDNLLLEILKYSGYDFNNGVEDAKNS